jgi:hypothetical protein
MNQQTRTKSAIRHLLKLGYTITAPIVVHTPTAAVAGQVNVQAQTSGGDRILGFRPPVNPS